MRIAGINAAGVGSSTPSTPLHLDPGMKPEPLDEMDGVSVSVIKADSSVSVAESSTSLLLGWQKRTSLMVKEIHKISLLSASGTVSGLFALTFANATTDSLNIDISASVLKAALESLPTMRSIEIKKSVYNPNLFWFITFLDECLRHH